MPEPLLLGIDLGAGSLKSTVIGAGGKVLATASVAVETLTPRPGFSEQRPEGWWAALVGSLHEIWQAGVDPARVVAVSVTAGAHTHVLEDAEGHILRPAIMWMDVRATKQAARADSLEDQVRRYNAGGTQPSSAEWAPFKIA